MLDEPLAHDPARPGDHVDDALRNPSLEDKLPQPQRRERRQLRRLQHDRVAGRERGPELPARDVEREVPRHDQPANAERLAKGDVGAAVDGNRLAVVLVHGAGVEMEDVGDHRHLAARTGDRLSHVPRLDLRQLLGVVLDETREPPEQAGAIGHPDGAPGGERGARTCHGLVDGGHVCRLQLGDRLLRRRVEDSERHEPGVAR